MSGLSRTLESMSCNRYSSRNSAMTTNDHPECYGTLFPSLLRLPEDRPASGTVFTVLLERAGGMWRCNRSITADMQRWNECQ